MNATQDYMKPQFKSAPPLFILRVASWLSVMVLLAGIFVLFKILVWEFSDENFECSYSSSSSCTSGFSLAHWLVPVILGSLLLYLFSYLKKHYYKEVQQGKVVGKDFTVVNGYSAHMLKLHGYNRVGQMTYYWRGVTAGTYEKYKEGDFITFR